MDESLFNTEPEIAVLSILINNPDKIFSINGTKSFMFSSIANKMIFDTLDEISKEGLIPDLPLLENHLKSNGKLEKLGGAEYLNYIRSQSYEQSNLREYEKLIIDSYKARSLLSIATGVSSTVTRTSNIDDIILDVRKAIDNLTISSGGEDTVLIGDVLNSSIEEIAARTKNPGIQGKTTGFNNIDLPSAGFCAGDLWIIDGRPGQGKTSFMLNTVLNGAVKGVKSLIFSMEMSRQQLIERMIAIETGISIINIRTGIITGSELDKIKATIDKFKDFPVYIDTNYSADLNYYESTLRKFKKLNDIDISYLDNINLLSERSADATNEIGRISRRGKLLSNELAMTNVIVAQLNRNVEMRDDKRPRLSDLRQSGNLEEDADVVLGLYRDAYYNKDTPNKNTMEAIFLKQRSGPTGTVFMKFNEETNKVEDG